MRDDRKKILITDLNFSNFRPQKNMSKTQNQVLKFKEIKKRLDEFVKKYPPEQDIYIEGIFIKPAFLNSSEVIIKFHGFLISYFIQHNINYFPPKTIKKEITGNGNAGKIEVRKILEEKYNIRFKNEDQSDAFAVMEYWIRKEGEKIDENKKNKILFD